jgi:hypothetical protein
VSHAPWVSLLAFRLVLVGVLATCASCSLTGLDRFQFPVCGQCEVLNTRDSIDPDACMRWQCDSRDRDCALSILDQDGDHHGAPRCGGDDCDDAAPTVFPGGTESCNALDDDCNGLVDDISAPPLPPITLIASVGRPPFATYTDLQDGIGVAWASGESAAFAQITQTVDATTQSGELAFATNMDPTAALVQASTRMGAPSETLMPLDPTPCGPLPDETCPSGTHCVSTPTSERICEAPVLNTGPPVPAGECLTHAECQDGIVCNGRETCEPRSDPSLIDSRGCRMRRPPPSVDPCATMAGATCDEARVACVSYAIEPGPFADLAIAPLTTDAWIAVPITDHCPMGTVRPGFLEVTASSPVVLLRGDDRLSSSWLGIDRNEQGCTGASRASGMAGGAGVAVAALGVDLPARPRPSALAAWRVAPVCTASVPLAAGCSAVTSAPVEIVGLWYERGAAGGVDIDWIDATGDGVTGTPDGVPVTLADESAGTRVSVASWEVTDAGGWVVGYPRAGGGVALTVVESLPPPAPNCPASPACLTAEHVTQLDATAPNFHRRDTSPLMTLDAMAFDATAALTGNVSVATFGDGNMVQLRLAYATPTEVVLVEATYDPATDAITDGMRLRWPADRAADVSVMHAAGGIATPGGVVEGTPIDDTNAGGLVIAWSTAEGTFAVRVSDATHAEVSPGPVRIGEATRQPRGFVDVDMMGVPHVHVIAEGDADFVGLLACGT